MEYYDPIWLISMGRRIGTPLRIDVSAASADRGRYAKLCVEINLSKPLFSKFRLRGKIKRIEYEGIHVICFTCGRYGHRKEDCGHGKEGNESTTSVVNAGEDFRRPESKNTETYGNWMIAKKTVRRKGKSDVHNGLIAKKGDHIARIEAFDNKVQPFENTGGYERKNQPVAKIKGAEKKGDSKNLLANSFNVL